MATLNEIATARKRSLRAIRVLVSTVRRHAIRMESRLNRTIQRRRNVPTTADFETFAVDLNSVDQDLDKVQKAFDDAAKVFNL